MNAIVPGLTEKQLAARLKGIGGSDARKIMNGNWNELWEEKTGRRQPEDLSRNLAVQMGNWTEAFNALWFELQTGIKVDRSQNVKQKTHIHPVHSFMICHVDGQVTVGTDKRVWEAKHTNPFGSTDDVRETSYAQLQHNIEVSGFDGIELSVFYGNAKWARFSVERDPDYIAELMAREAEFWSYVEKDAPPPRGGIAAVTVTFDKLRTVNMRTNNMWCDSEATWIKFREAVAASKDADAALRGMVEVDVGFAFGSELVCVRDRAGKLTLREPNKNDTRRIGESLLREQTNVER